MSSLSKNTFDIKFEDILEQVSKYIEDEEQNLKRIKNKSIVYKILKST